MSVFWCAQLQASFVPVFFTIRNVVQTPTTYTFDVYAEVTDTFYLNTYQLYIAYNTAAFGPSIVANNNFSNLLNNNPHITLYDTLWPLPVPKYKLVNVVDNTSNILAITVDTRLIVQTPACLSDSNAITIFEGFTPRPLARITMTFTNAAQPPGISLYLPLMIDQFIGGNDSCNLVQGDPSILPASFLGVEASYLGNEETEISWEIASERDVVTYEIEKETDGEHFFPIGRIQAANRPRYTFVDGQATESRATYRIRAINPNGHFMYSETVEVFRDASRRLSPYPNPARDVLHIKGIREGESWAYRLFDIRGKLLRFGTITSEGIVVDFLPSGLYLMELADPEGTQSHSLKFQRL